MSEYLKFKHVIQAPIIPTSKQTRFNTDLGSWPAMICWKIPTQAPLFPSQYSGLGSSLSNTSNALAA